MIRALLVGAALASAFLTETAQADSTGKNELDEIRREIFFEGIRDCHPLSMTRCWNLFFGSGDLPRRKLWLIDLKDHSGGGRGEIVYTDTLQIHESEKTAPDGPAGCLLLRLFPA